MALTHINLGSVPNDGKGDNLRTAGSKINANFAQLTKLEFETVAALLANSNLGYGSGAGQVAAGDIIRTRKEDHAYEVAASGARDEHVQTAGGVRLYVLPTQEGHLPAVGFGWQANNNQSAAAGNHTALDKALRAGSAQGRLVAIPAGVGFTSRGWRYENGNYRGSGIIGLGARGSSIIRFANALSGGGSDRVWMINLHEPNTSYHFTLINVMLDGNWAGNAADASCGLRMTLGNIAEHVFLDKVDTCNFGNGARRWLGGITENACIDRDGRSWNNQSASAHGFSTRSGVTNFGHPVIFENCVAWDNGGYNFDISSGSAIVKGTMHLFENKNSQSGSMKMSVESERMIADRIISEDAQGVGFRTTGDPLVDVNINVAEFHRSSDVGFRTQASRLLKFGHLKFVAGKNQDFLPTTEAIDIDVLELLDGDWNDNDSAGSSGYQCFLRGPLRYVRIGKLIAHNNRSRVLLVRPDSNTPTPATLVDIGYLELVDNNRSNHGSNYLIEADSRNHPVHMRIRDGAAYDTRGTPRQTRIFRAYAEGGRAARIDINRFVFGAGAQSGSRFSTSGTGAAITVGESIGV